MVQLQNPEYGFGVSFDHKNNEFFENPIFEKDDFMRKNAKIAKMRVDYVPFDRCANMIFSIFPQSRQQNGCLLPGK